MDRVFHMTSVSDGVLSGSPRRIGIVVRAVTDPEEVRSLRTVRTLVLWGISRGGLFSTGKTHHKMEKDEDEDEDDNHDHDHVLLVSVSVL